MRVFVTGYQGYIGSRVYAHFQAQPGVETIGFHLSPARDAVSTCCATALFAAQQADPTVIVHCGAIANSRYAYPDIYLWNTTCTNALAAYAAARNRKFIFLSSCMASDSSTHYGMSKYLSEDYILSHASSACILRLFNVWGDEEAKPPERYSVPMQVLTQRLRFLFDVSRDYVHISDVVKAVQVAVAHSGLWDVGTGVTTTARDLCDMVGYTGAEPADAHDVLGAGIPQTFQAITFLPDWHATSIAALLPEMASC